MEASASDHSPQTTKSDSGMENSGFHLNIILFLIYTFYMEKNGPLYMPQILVRQKKKMFDSEHMAKKNRVGR